MDIPVEIHVNDRARESEPLPGLGVLDQKASRTAVSFHATIPGYQPTPLVDLAGLARVRRNPGPGHGRLHHPGGRSRLEDGGCEPHARDGSSGRGFSGIRDIRRRSGTMGRCPPAFHGGGAGQCGALLSLGSVRRQPAEDCRRRSSDDAMNAVYKETQDEKFHPPHAAPAKSENRASWKKNRNRLVQIR